MKKAVVVMEFIRHEKHVVVLKAISDRSLREVAQGPVDVSANDLIFLNLTREQYQEFKQDSQSVGTITVTFSQTELADSIKPGIISTLEIGNVLEIGIDEYIIVEKKIVEDRGSQYHRLTLAKFENLTPGSFTTTFHTLDIGSNFLYSLDGEYASIAHDLGQADIDIHLRRGPTLNAVMSATVVEWQSGEARTSKIIPALQLKDYKSK